MGKLRTVDDVVASLPFLGDAPLPAPRYQDTGRRGAVMMAVASMRDHTTNEGWQLAQALECAGYVLVGHGIGGEDTDVTNVPNVLSRHAPGTVVLQDKREWDFPPGNFRDHRATFSNVHLLRDSGAFVLTVLKDAHQKPAYHRTSAEEIGCHAWVTYYHPAVVECLAPYVRRCHLVRTYHSVDRLRVPEFTSRRGDTCLVSGAVSGVYPLRKRMMDGVAGIPGGVKLKHPGYHRNGTATDAYLAELSRHKVAVCTSSTYGYTLRKIVEATACGCVVVTDLPVDETMPEIDGNLYRVSVDTTVEEMAEHVAGIYRSWDPCAQMGWANRAVMRYDYRYQGMLLAMDIERLREDYK